MLMFFSFSLVLIKAKVHQSMYFPCSKNFLVRIILYISGRNTSNMKDYHANIKRFRESRSFTQEYMSEVLGLSQRAYSSIENGQTQLTVDKLLDIADTLKVSVSDIIGYDSRYVYNNNFNNNATENKGSLIFNQDNLEEYKELYERLIKSKDEEIETLKKVLEKIK